MTDLTATRSAFPPAQAPGPEPLAAQLERHRAELTAHCRRTLGSASEAEDAVQETLVRAWRSHDRFQGRATLRTWLYSIATNVCIDMLRRPQRRECAVDFTSPTPVDGPIGPAWSEVASSPLTPESCSPRAARDPSEAAVDRETIRLAFLAALRHLNPRQRAVLILRDVLRWKATEVAELLGTTAPAVNSALQRARSTLATSDLTTTDRPDRPHPIDGPQRDLLARYVDAFERYDVESLISLLQSGSQHRGAAVSDGEDAVAGVGPERLYL